VTMMDEEEEMRCTRTIGRSWMKGSNSYTCEATWCYVYMYQR